MFRSVATAVNRAAVRAPIAHFAQPTFVSRFATVAAPHSDASATRTADRHAGWHSDHDHVRPHDSLHLSCSSPSSCVGSRSKVFFDVQIGNGPVKRIQFELASDIVPKVHTTHTNTCTGSKGRERQQFQ